MARPLSFQKGIGVTLGVTLGPRNAAGALATFEKALGPEHPHVAQSLENYAALLRKTGRATEASKMEARAEAIRSKHNKEAPQRRGFLDRLFGK